MTGSFGGVHLSCPVDGLTLIRVDEKPKQPYPPDAGVPAPNILLKTYLFPVLNQL